MNEEFRTASVPRKIPLSFVWRRNKTALFWRPREVTNANLQLENSFRGMPNVDVPGPKRDIALFSKDKNEGLVDQIVSKTFFFYCT